MGFITFCQHKDHTHNSLHERKISIAIPSLPSSINESIHHPLLYSLIHEGLTSFHFIDDKLTVRPAMARDWIFESPLILRIRLDEARALDGKAFTATELATQLEKKLKTPTVIPCQHWQQRVVNVPITKIRVPNDRTLVVHFSQPCPNFLFVLACPELWPERQSIHKKAILAGPFHVIDERVSEWQLAPSPFFRQPLAANLHIVVRSIDNSLTRGDLVEQREVDLATEVTPEFIPRRASFQYRMGLSRYYLVALPGREWTQSGRAGLFSALKNLTGENSVLLFLPEILGPSLKAGFSNFWRPARLYIPPILENLGHRIVAEWRRQNISIEKTHVLSHADMNLVEVPIDPTEPHRWPSAFPYGPATKPTVVAPTHESLEKAYQNAMETNIQQARIWPLATSYSRDLTTKGVNAPSSFYGGWDFTTSGG